MPSTSSPSGIRKKPATERKLPPLPPVPDRHHFQFLVAGRAFPDDLLAYSFVLDGEEASARPADICFAVAGGNEARGYRSNSIVILRGEIHFARESGDTGARRVK
jgi:hypothetical protein